MEVEWDEAKNLANQRPHGISFEEAVELFTSGIDYLQIFDETHSESCGPSVTRTPSASSAPGERPAGSERSLSYLEPKP